METDKGSGTAFFMHHSGLAITCAHVVNGAKEIYVRMEPKQGLIFKASIVNINSSFDLAIIKLEEGNEFISTKLDISDNISIGDEIVILGFPFGSRVSDNVMSMSASYTKGYISSIQHINNRTQVLLDISAKSGNSGSPVININTGAVIGVLSGSILSGSKHIEEVNYMIPISYIKYFFE